MIPKRSQSLAARLAGPAAVLFAAFVAITPYLVRGDSCGHDFEYHIVSWIDALHSWRQGILYPHWTPAPMFGAGEPRFMFYPPLAWMSGAALGAAMPWRYVPIVLSFLLFAGAGLATRALARQVMENAPATLAGCVAIFSGYTLFCSYERSAYPELFDAVWIPLLLLFLLRDRNPSAPLWKRVFDGSAVPLALALACAWLSNDPAALMATYLMAAVAVTVALLSRSWAPFLRATVSGTLGLGLASFYFIPAVWEQRWIDITKALTDRGLNIESSWLFGHHPGADLAFHDHVLYHASLIAAGMITTTLVCVLVSWRRKTLPGTLRWWLPLAAIPAVVLFLLLPISLPVWNLAPKLRYLQFPWRWLIVVGTPMGVFFASAVWTNRPRARIVVVAACAALAVATASRAGTTLFYRCYSAYNAASAVVARYHAGTLKDGSDQYAPGNADGSLVAMYLPDACFNTQPDVVLGQMDPSDNILTWSPDQHTCAATFNAQPIPGKGLTEHFQIHADTAGAGYLILRLRTYPAWQVRVNGRVIHSMPQRDDGLMAVPVPKGSVHVTVNWIATPDVVVGRWVTALSVLLLAGLAWWEKKHSLARL